MIAAWRARKAARPGTRRPRRSQRPATWRVGASTQRRQVPTLRGPIANPIFEFQAAALAAATCRSERTTLPTASTARTTTTSGLRTLVSCVHLRQTSGKTSMRPCQPPDEIAPGVVAAGNNFKVVVRVRPPLPRELSGDKRFQNIARIDRDRTITLCENLVRPASGSCVTL